MKCVWPGLPLGEQGEGGPYRAPTFLATPHAFQGPILPRPLGRRCFSLGDPEPHSHVAASSVPRVNPGGLPSPLTLPPTHTGPASPMAPVTAPVLCPFCVKVRGWLSDAPRASFVPFLSRLHIVLNILTDWQNTIPGACLRTKAPGFESQ